MSVHTLLSNKQIREWAKVFYEKDTSLGANDFELALRDYSFLKDNARFSQNFEYLHWFEFSQPALYSRSLENYLNYLTYVLLIRILKTQTFEVSTLEKYLTDQVLGYLTHNKSSSVELKELYTHWKNVYSVLEMVVQLLQKYTRLSTTTSAYFSTATKDTFRIDIPLVGWDDPSQIDCFLFLQFSGKKPNWYSIPALYKIYSYFASHNICVKSMNILWFSLDNISVKPILEQIPLTKNVAEMVSRYASVEPFPYANIFDSTNPRYYNKTPLSIILK